MSDFSRSLLLDVGHLLALRPEILPDAGGAVCGGAYSLHNAYSGHNKGEVTIPADAIVRNASATNSRAEPKGTVLRNKK